MKKLFKKFEDLMLAVTFAEAGEYETAKEMLDETKQVRAKKLDSALMLEAESAVTEGSGR